MSGGSLFAPLGGLLSRFGRGGGLSLWVRSCPALACNARGPAYAVPYTVRSGDLAWVGLTGPSYSDGYAS
jgi:hypothetical protein